jgi:urease accessory protein UreF
MAWVGPALAYVGGGSQVAGAITVATAAAGAYSAAQTHKAGQIAKADAKAAASREADAAREEEIQRRRGLLRVLADRNAAAGAAGGGTGGSIGALTRTDIRDNRNDLLISNINSSTRQRILRASGSQAARSATVQAGASLLDSASTLYQNMPRPTPKPKNTMSL